MPNPEILKEKKGEVRRCYRGGGFRRLRAGQPEPGMEFP